MLAAQYVGAAIVPVAEQYALIPAARGRLIEAIELVRPKLAYVADADAYAGALELEALDKIEIVAGRRGGRAATAFDDMLKGAGGDAAVDAAHAAVGPETVGKILMTSGSTSSPKGVLTTHGMMCVNQAQLAEGLPFLTARPPRIVDWLPWNHVFGGSHNFNMMLANGGSLYVDNGKPLKGRFDETVENLSLMTGTLTFNVPVGFALLLAELRKDRGLRRRFFEDLDMIFYAGASLPQEVWEGFEQMAMEVKGEVPLMTSSWGLTETAPAVLLQQEPTPSSGVVGAPLPGLEVKMIPLDDQRCEVRVKGRSVMTGYLNAPGKTASAFDDEGYFITGDAMSLVNPDDPNAGLRFEGRISEDFKLLTGTWVRATALRASVLAHLSPLAADLVITGHDRSEVGVLIIPNLEAVAAAGFAVSAAGGVMTEAALRDEFARRLREAGEGAGSSMRISRALVLAEPPSLAEGEITAKGNLNFRRILTRREALLHRCYDNADPAAIKI
ncbi:MAG: AMP-binding protein [Pseudomonadota bacterium]